MATELDTELDRKPAATSDLKPMDKSMLKVGRSIAYSIYDADGGLVLKAGYMIENQEQIDQLTANKLYLKASQLRGRARALLQDDLETSGKNAAGKNEIATVVETNFVLASSNINIGDTLQLMPHNEQAAVTQYFVKLIGGMEKGSLICSLPIVDERTVFIKEFSSFAVRIFTGKNVYAFNAMATAVLSRPYPHLHLSYPKIVTVTRLRRNQRVKANPISVLYNLQAGQHEKSKIPGRMMDISLGGALLELLQSPGTQGDKVECSFKIAIGEVESLFLVPGIIRTLKQTSDEHGGGVFQCGLEFSDMNLQEKSNLQGYIFEQITGQRLDNL